jgi:hypothetical protein
MATVRITYNATTATFSAHAAGATADGATPGEALENLAQALADKQPQPVRREWSRPDS